MKIFYPPLLASLSTIAFVISACTLDTEPEIPTGVNNITGPVFFNAGVTTDTNDNFHVTARLSTLGNLNIQYHGWVWSKTQGPTLQGGKLLLGPLNIDSFSNTIPGLDLGEIYYLRPVVITGNDTIYGQELCSFLGVNFTINTDMEIFQGADVQFTNTTVGNCTYLWIFGNGDTSTAASPPVHTYNTPGNTTVLLTAYLNGCSVTKAMVLKIIPDPFENYWVTIQGGSFMMGCTAEQEPCGTDELETPVHLVSLNAFILGKTEITQAQWQAVMGNNPSTFNQCGQDCPVESVSWYDIKNNFLPALYRKTGRIHRLPTEAEWEYAARGSADASSMTTYAGSDNLDMVGWYGMNSGATPHPVAQKLPNQFGLYDMSGNVWEWVEDDYHEDYTGAPANGSAWVENPDSGGRMYRGGSWQSGNAEGCRVANRGGDPTDIKRDRLGFRIVRSN